MSSLTVPILPDLSPACRARNTDLGTVPTLGYQDQYTDPTTGTVNMGARWYDPATGGFASRDTTGLDPRDQNNNNRYTYAASNPLTNTDPTGRGLCSIVFGGIGDFVGGAVGSALGPWGTIGGAFLGGIVGDYAGQALCDAPVANAPTLGDRYANAAFPNADQERRQLQALARRDTGPAILVTLPDGRRGVVSHGHVYVTSGKNGGGRIVDPAAAARAAEQARAERVRQDALTPHARPSATPTIAADIQAAIDAALNAPPINLGILDPTTVNGGNQPYQPQTAGPEIAFPAPSGMPIANPDGFQVLFGQKRADPYFSTKPGVPDYLKGRLVTDVAQDLRNGLLTSDQIQIEVFEYKGILVSTNTRGLTALSLARLRPTNMIFTSYGDLSNNTRKRLNEMTLLGDMLPATRIPVTPGRNSDTILYIAEIP
jgi:RHS repeat-associated protein